MKLKLCSRAEHVNGEAINLCSVFDYMLALLL